MKSTKVKGLLYLKRFTKNLLKIVFKVILHLLRQLISVAIQFEPRVLRVKLKFFHNNFNQINFYSNGSKI